VSFSGNARFRGATFSKYATFAGAHFRQQADFTAIHGERAFNLSGATFDILPDFIQAHFDEAPRLDNLTLAGSVEGRGFWRPLLRASPADTPARYRALRRLAVQGHDHDNERRFLKREIRSRRYILDKPFHAAFWFGAGYDVLSDFGGSISRPFYWGLASVLAFAGLYYAIVFAGCGPTPAEAFDQALYLSLKNAVLLINWDGADIPKAAKCLADAKEASTRFALVLAAAQIVQKIWSAGLLFLFLLAVRNRFKIR
jgi:hypothetical protein